MASKADALYKQEKFEELYKALSEYNKRISNNPEALWRNARAAYELAKVFEVNGLRCCSTLRFEI